MIVRLIIALALSLSVTHVFAKSCDIFIPNPDFDPGLPPDPDTNPETISNPDFLEPEFCELPTAAAPGDPVEDAAGQNQKSFDPLFIGNGPQIGQDGSVAIYDVPARFTLLESQETEILAPRSAVAVPGTGDVRVGVKTDYVFADTEDNALVFGLRVVLDASVEGRENVAEFNDFLRTGNAGHALGAAWSERRQNQDLRLYRAVRTATRFGEGSETYDPDVVKLQSDLNQSEGNPRSGYFFLQSSASCHSVSKNSLELFQGGEEGQTRLSLIFDSFVAAAACVDTEDVRARVSFPGFIKTPTMGNPTLRVSNVQNPDSAVTTASELVGCTSADGVEDLTSCVEVATTAVFDTDDPDNWPLVCFEYDVTTDLDPLGIAETDLGVKKCEMPGGDCCVIGAGDGANACLTTCPGGDCSAWNVGREDALSALADPAGGDTTGRYCIATPNFSEFSLAVAAGPAARVPALPAAGLCALAAGLAWTARRRRRAPTHRR